ncbi:hypothetical protein [Nonomuraea sp. NPDC049695]|uniref:hypothetical protein n=1 Tax=Nonomuraea sp. NPDC049695 TaxID=3154734 RepID=UPI003419F702
MRARNGSGRGAVFAAVVVVLAAVGVWLAAWPDSPDRPERAPRATASSSTPPAAPPSAPPAPSPSSTGPFDVYDYLPLRAEQLAATADLAERFTAVYGTFRYDEDPAAHVGRVRAYTTPELGDVLATELTAPSRVGRNRDGQVVSTATGKLKQVRRISGQAVVFVVTETRRLTTKRGNERETEELAVTVSRAGGDWRVFDVRPAAEGQDGDCPSSAPGEGDPCREQGG